MVTRGQHRAIGIGAIVVVALLAGCAGGDAGARGRWNDTHARYYASHHDVQGSVSPDTTAIEDLEALIVTAESTSPALRASFDRWKAALERVPQATALPDPRVSYAYFIEPVETRVGPQRQRFGISQTIPLFGKLGLRGAVAVNAANAAGADFEAARLALRFRLTKLWNDYYYLSREIAITDENVRLLQRLESVALSQYAAGGASHGAVIRAQVELGRLEDRLLTVRDRRGPIVAALNAELGRSPDAVIPSPVAIDTTSISLSADALRAALLERNPELTARTYREEEAAAGARLAGKSALPDLTLGAEYIDTDEARFPDVADSGKDAAVAQASINLPLWFGRTRAEKAQADARLSAARHDVEQLRNRLLSDLEQALFDYRDSERRVNLYALTLLPKARQSLAVAEDSFTTGKMDFLDLVDAQRTLLEFQLAHERALVDRSNARARLDQMTGLDIVRGPVTKGM